MRPVSFSERVGPRRVSNDEAVVLPGNGRESGCCNALLETTPFIFMAIADG
jgi:hypothetical protein